MRKHRCGRLCAFWVTAALRRAAARRPARRPGARSSAARPAPPDTTAARRPVSEPPGSPELMARHQGLRRRQLRRGAKDLRGGRKKNPNDFQAFFNLGHGLREARRQAAAEAAYKSALAVKPDLDTAAAALSALYIDAGADRRRARRGAGRASPSTRGAPRCTRTWAWRSPRAATRTTATQEFAGGREGRAGRADVPPDVRALAQRLEGARRRPAPRRGARPGQGRLRCSRRSASSTGWPASSTRA